MKSINFRTAKFLKSAPSLDQCPPDRGAEVAFAGRSNAGKSSALNKLADNKNLAHTSKTPGRTQMINFFQLQESDLRLVDLPGYGYAKVSKQVKRKWQENLAQYLHERQSLKGLVLVMDIRLPMQELDVMMINWAIESEMRVHALLTKSDKLKRGAARNALLKFQREMKSAGVGELVSAQIFSAQNGEGVDELTRRIKAWLEHRDK